MPNILVRNVPEAVHTVLASRAAAEGQSLQQYVLDLLAAAAARRTARETVDVWRTLVEEALASGELSPAVTTEDIVSAIHEGREERTDRILEAIDESRGRRRIDRD